jgi:hypothetical protein
VAIPRPTPKTKSEDAPDFQQSPFSQDSQFPDPNARVKMPRKPILAILRERFVETCRFIFSDEFQVTLGYSCAIGAVASGALGYYSIINAVAQPLGLGSASIWGLRLIPLIVGVVSNLIVQYIEIAPRKHLIFPHLADRAAFKTGREVMVDPKESANKSSMLPTFKFLARNGDSIAAKKANNASMLMYIVEGISAFIAIGVLLVSTNPIIQIGAVIWAAYSVFGCEFGLSHAESANRTVMTAAQERDYRATKEKLEDSF